MATRTTAAGAAGLLVLAAWLGSAPPALAQAVSVTVNGTPLQLTPAPTERGGRVFVPLRGLFEQLGASVVYQNGEINAQGGGRAVALHIGSTQATVNGQPQRLDVAPFVVGASTYVPLRFVSQALGAAVNYDAANKIVAIANAPRAMPPGQPPVTAPRTSALRLAGLQPADHASVPARRPTIEAQFGSASADPNTLRITLDQLDVTAATSRSASGFVYSPPSDLQSMRHVVRVTGTDATGAPFSAQWAFTSGTVSSGNALTEVRPTEGSQVGGTFTVSGQTTPGAAVVIQVGAVASGANSVAGEVGSILGLGGGNVRNAVTAGPDGSFSSVVRINALPSSTLKLVITSTDPRTQAAAPPVSRTLTEQ